MKKINSYLYNILNLMHNNTKSSNLFFHSNIYILIVCTILLLFSCSSSIRFAGQKDNKTTISKERNTNRDSNNKDISKNDSEDNNSNSNYGGFTEDGFASYYGAGFDGRITASGEVFDKSKLTAAHRTLPFGTIVQVKNMRNGKYVTVRINDRGPHKDGRIIDLSEAAAKEIDMIKAGVVPVEIRTLK